MYRVRGLNISKHPMTNVKIGSIKALLKEMSWSFSHQLWRESTWTCFTDTVCFSVHLYWELLYNCYTQEPLVCWSLLQTKVNVAYLYIGSEWRGAHPYVKMVGNSCIIDPHFFKTFSSPITSLFMPCLILLTPLFFRKYQFALYHI